MYIDLLVNLDVLIKTGFLNENKIFLMYVYMWFSECDICVYVVL